MIAARKIDFVKRNSGVCTMRRGMSSARHVVTTYTLDRERERSAARANRPWGRILSAEEIKSDTDRADERAAGIADQFAEAEQMALMQASHNHRHQHIWHRLWTNYEVPPFTLSTFRSLSERGLCVKPEGKTFHTLTAAGEKMADAVADKLVKQHDLHIAWIGGHVGATASVHCCCGWQAGIRYGEYTQANARRAHTQHLREVGKV